MPVYMMFGKYNADALKGVSPERTKKAVEIIGQHGGKVISMYAVLGEHDLVFLLGWPSHLGLMWENPAFANFLQGLASFSRLILLDHLGRGLEQ
jgi:hypothetical protein